MKTASFPRPLAALTPLERHQKISVEKAAALNDVCEKTFRKNYPHLIRKVGPRRDTVELGDAIDLPPPEAKFRPPSKQGAADLLGDALFLSAGGRDAAPSARTPRPSKLGMSSPETRKGPG